MAGEFARSVGAQQLILTHFSQRYRPLSAVDEATGDTDSVQKLLDQAVIAFRSDCVVAAEDLQTISIPLRKIEQ